MTPRQMSEYDHEALGDAIVRRLSELYVEGKHRAHINTRSSSRASPSAAFLATGDADIPKLNKDAQQGLREEHTTILPRLRKDWPLRIILLPQRGGDVPGCNQPCSIRHAPLSQAPHIWLATAAAQWRPT